MTLYFCAGERTIERVRVRGFQGEGPVVLTDFPDSRMVWCFRKNEEPASLFIDVPDDVARKYADPGGRVYRLPVELANEYLRPGAA
jgi:hypothetical protein